MAGLGFEDHVAICEAKARYCRCLDEKDWAGYADVFTEDAILDTRPSGGSEIRGRDALVAMVRGSIEAATTVHQVHAPEMTPIDGDTVDVIWAMQDRLAFDAAKARASGRGGLTGWGHYRERYRRGADGRWRIARSVLTRLHIEFHPVPDGAQ